VEPAQRAFVAALPESPADMSGSSFLALLDEDSELVEPSIEVPFRSARLALPLRSRPDGGNRLFIFLLQAIASFFAAIVGRVASGRAARMAGSFVVRRRSAE
jgi:hypothetical protein